MFTSITPGSGVTAKRARRGIVGRRVALEAHRAGEGARGRLDRAHEGHEVLRERHGRQEDVQAALARLDAERGADHLPGRGRPRRGAPGGRGARGLALAERVAALERIGGDDGLLVLRQHGRQRSERQAIAHGRIALDEEDVPAAQRPGRARPLRGARGLRAGDGLERNHEARGLPDGARELPGELRAHRAIGEVLGERIEAGRQVRLVAQDPPRILVGGQHVVGGEAERLRELGGEAPRILVRARRGGGRIRRDGLLAPERRAVPPPEARQRPARQRLAGVPLALAEVQQPAGREARAQAMQEVQRPARACAASARCSSTRRLPCRRRTRTWARRPW